LAMRFTPEGGLRERCPQMPAQCPICMRKVKLPNAGPSPQEAAHEDLKHIRLRKGDIPQQMFRELYSVTRQIASDKYEALRMARAAFREKYGCEPEYEKEYWLEGQ
jgi:hypothetical protein